MAGWPVAASTSPAITSSTATRVPRRARTYGEFRAAVDPDGTPLASLFTAFGLAEPDPSARLAADEEDRLERWPGLLEGVDDPDLLVRVVRLHGESARRTSTAALDVYEEAAARLGPGPGLRRRGRVRPVARPVGRAARELPDLAAWLAERHLRDAIDAFSVQTSEQLLAAEGIVPTRPRPTRHRVRRPHRLHPGHAPARRRGGRAPLAPAWRARPGRGGAARRPAGQAPGRRGAAGPARRGRRGRDVDGAAPGDRGGRPRQWARRGDLWLRHRARGRRLRHDRQPCRAHQRPRHGRRDRGQRGRGRGGLDGGGIRCQPIGAIALQGLDDVELFRGRARPT